MSETDSNGKITRYVYEEGSDRIKAKYLSYRDKIRLREFYFYDINHAVIKHLTDDGSQEDINDITDVTERHIQTFATRMEAPIGLPEITDEWSQDGAAAPTLLKRTICSYSPQGRLLKQQVLDANLKEIYHLEWDYDRHGNVISETDALGNRTENTYNLATDNLEESVGPDITIRYTYDHANRLIEQKEIHPDQKLFIQHKYDLLGNKKATIDLFDQKTRRIFDDFGRVIEIHSPEVLLGNTLVSSVVKTAYDIAGFPVALTNPNGEVTRIEVNIRGQPTRIDYPDGTSEEMLYSLEGWLMQKKDRQGVLTQYFRDPIGRVEQEIVSGGEERKQTFFRYNAFHLLEQIDPEGTSTFYRYDQAGRLKEIVRGNQKTEQYYDAQGLLAEIREYTEGDDYRATVKKYDKIGRIIEELLQNKEGKTIHSSSFKYDDRGNCILAQVGQTITKTEYNTRNQPTLVTDGLGHQTHMTYNLNFVNIHNQRVLQKTTTDPMGYRSVETYDTLNRLVEMVRYSPMGNKVGRQAYFYDLAGNRTKVEEEVIENGEVNQIITTLFFYDSAGQLKQMTEAFGTSEQKITRIKYNHLGQKETLIKPNGIEIFYTYDGFGRLSTCISSDRSVAYQYHYNVLDQPTSVIDLNTNQATEREYIRGEISKECLANGLSIAYTYDRTGRARTLTFPDQSGVEYVYDAVDLREVHRVVNGKRGYSHLDLSHSLSGQVIVAKPPGNNQETYYTYDLLDRCVSIHSPAFQQEVPKDGFDRAGNLLKCETQKIAYTYLYDDHYHIKKEGGHTSHTYTFDSLANCTSKDNERNQFNGLNQLVQKGSQQLHYDLNGNLTRNGQYEYTYDALDRLVRVACHGREATYTYDAFGRRLSKICDGEEELFLYQGQDEIGSWKNGVCRQLRLIGKNPQSKTVAIEIAGICYVPIHDRQGNVVLLLDLDGNEVEHYRYSAFGEREILSPQGSKVSSSFIGNPWQYAGKRIDEESGLIAFGIRYYHPNLSRWTTPDPAGFVDGSNLYAYVHNNPLLYVDRYGLWAEFSYQSTGIFQAYKFYENQAYNNICTNLGAGEYCQEITHFNIEDKLELRYNQSKKESDPPFYRTTTYSANDFINPATNNKYNFTGMPHDKKVLFVNGIDNTLDDFKKSLVHMSSLIGYNFEGIHCPTFGFSIDAICYKEAISHGAAYEGCRELQKHIREFHANSSAGATMMVIAHSRANAYVLNCLKDCSPEERERVDVRGFAPGAYISMQYCKSVEHYHSKRDFIVPYIDSSGRKRCKDTITVLKPHSKAPWHDHAFTSPTLTRKIAEILEDYMEG